MHNCLTLCFSQDKEINIFHTIHRPTCYIPQLKTHKQFKPLFTQNNWLKKTSMKLNPAKILVQDYLELNSMTLGLSEWTEEHFKDNPPRLLRLQRSGLLELFGD